jgi:hypothetical protein
MMTTSNPDEWHPQVRRINIRRQVSPRQQVELRRLGYTHKQMAAMMYPDAERILWRHEHPDALPEAQPMALAAAAD